jgi:hypothetical protein
VRKADTGARQDEQAADPQRRGRRAFGLLIQLGPTDEYPQGEQKQRGGAETDERRQQQRVPDLRGLRPIDPACLIGTRAQLVGQTDTDDRSD